MNFRTRDLFVGEATQMINAVRANFAEHNFAAPQGTTSLAGKQELSDYAVEMKRLNR